MEGRRRGGFTPCIGGNVTRVGRRTADVLSLAVGVAWGLSFTVGKFLIAYLGPALYVGITFTAAGILLAAWLLVARVGVRRRAIAPGIALGLVLASASVLQCMGLRATSPGVSGLLTDLAVVLTPLFAYALHGVRPGVRALAAVVLAATGAVALAWGGGGPGALAGDLLALGGAALYSLYAVALDRVAPEEDALGVAAFALGGGGFAALAWAALSGAHVAAGPTPAFTGEALAYEVLVGTLAGFAVQSVAQRQGGPTRFALLTSVDGVAALAFGVLLAGERLTPSGVVGAVLVLAAVASAQTERVEPRRRRAPLPPPSPARAPTAPSRTASRPQAVRFGAPTGR
jgi:drug/metabolite transporter (DMT)-like permease